MKAIKIPNAALLDVFGRPVAINNHDLHRPSILPIRSRKAQTEKISLNSHHEAQNKSSTVTTGSSKLDNSERLSVIGKLTTVLI